MPDSVSTDTSPTLSYARPGTTRLKPTRHSALAVWAWAAVILEAAYRGGVVAFAYHRSYTYPWLRFHRNVGDPELFIGIDKAILGAGGLLAVLALVHPFRKRWAAALALAACAYLLCAKLDCWASSDAETVSSAADFADCPSGPIGHRLPPLCQPRT